MMYYQVKTQIKFYPANNRDPLCEYRLYLAPKKDMSIFVDGFELGAPVPEKDGMCHIDLSVLPGVTELHGEYLYRISMMNSDGVEMFLFPPRNIVMDFRHATSCERCRDFRLADTVRAFWGRINTLVADGPELAN
jgi:hypothetical protein